MSQQKLVYSSKVKSFSKAIENKELAISLAEPEPEPILVRLL
jgi:hypothetical protein